MEISHSRRFLFVHIPKTGGTTIAEEIGPFSETLHRNILLTALHALPLSISNPKLAWFEQHDYAARIRRKLKPEVWDSFFTFSCVRNPFDHAISHYEASRKLPYSQVKRRLQSMNFENYLAWRLSASRPDKFNRIWRFARMPDQAFFLCDQTGQLIVQRVLKTERLQEDINTLFCDLSLPPPKKIGHARKSKDRKPPAEYLTSEAVELIRQIYARDFELFDYSREVPEHLK